MPKLDDLVSLAAQHGYRINRQWLSKYARIGLLPPRPAPRGLGRGKGRGGAYSPDTARQLVALLQLLKMHGKNLSKIGWVLWVNGFDVHQRYWRDPLIDAASKWETAKQFLIASNNGYGLHSEEMAEQIYNKLQNSRPTNPIFGNARRHLGSEFKEFFELINSVIAGAYVEVDATTHDAREMEISTNLLSKSLSIPKSFSDFPKGEIHFPIDVPQIDNQFTNFNELASINMSEFLAELDDAEIITARNEIFPIIGTVVNIEQFWQQQFGKSLGIKSLVWSVQNTIGQVTLLLGWLALRQDPEMVANANFLVGIIQNLASETMQKKQQSEGDGDVPEIGE